MELTKKELNEIKVNSKIDKFYLELLIPAIPVEIIRSSKSEDIVLLLENLVYLVGKRLANGRSILDNKLAYRNLYLNTKNTKRKAA
jgi:hypothetical protein